ncbi:MAG: Asp-tRNA(Asn)/Glu-tRNA(Gln) amidotransferase subunit GatC [Anaerolineae bacterium]|jgi:aspartyl-tRNA(Asn)/glutamyl-tRNA(Gln) amidotransferase subunit C
MKLSREQVEHIADLAKLALSDREIATYQAQLSAILDHFEHLQELDTEEIPPTATVLPLRGVTRLDKIEAPMTQEEALKNAPEAEDGCYSVPAVLDKQDA